MLGTGTRTRVVPGRVYLGHGQDGYIEAGPTNGQNYVITSRASDRQCQDGARTEPGQSQDRASAGTEPVPEQSQSDTLIPTSIMTHSADLAQNWRPSC